MVEEMALRLWIVFLALPLVLAGTAAYALWRGPWELFEPAARQDAGKGAPATTAPADFGEAAVERAETAKRQKEADGMAEEKTEDVQVVASGLVIPWEIAWLPEGDMLVTERPGRLVRIGRDRSVITVRGVVHAGEGGLQGLALHPDFKQNNRLYLYLTAETEQGLTNRVESYRLRGGELQDRTVVLDGLPGARYHDGGRIAFGPDGWLYVTVGDATRAREAQNPDSYNGTILRVRDDGSAVPGNPGGTRVYSYGHRNGQGLAWDEQGRLWATEHGRSGLKSGLDEINLVQPGQNYGWPVIEGDQRRAGMRSPVIHSGASVTWAPAGAAWYQGKLFFAGLRGESLYEAKIEGTRAGAVTSHFSGRFGRLRAVKVGPDGWLYVSTSNRDGRGEKRAGDDKIIRVNPRVLGY